MTASQFSFLGALTGLLIASSAFAQEAPPVPETPAATPAPAPAANHREVSLRYHVVFDVDNRGDQFCRFTGLCDCESIYVGTGTLLEAVDGRSTFAGTWAAESNTCGANLTIWVPEDGRAHHTLRFDAAGQVTEWVTHARAAQHTRLQQDIKQQGQVWLSPMAAPIQDGKARHQESENQDVGVGLASTHTLDIALK